MREIVPKEFVGNNELWIEVEVTPVKRENLKVSRKLRHHIANQENTSHEKQADLEEENNLWNLSDTGFQKRESFRQVLIY